MNGAIVIFQNVEKQSDRQETWVQYLTHNNSLIKSDWEPETKKHLTWW